MNRIYTKKNIQNNDKTVLKVICLLLCFWLGIGQGYAFIRYVTPSGSGSGITWSLASGDIAAMIAGASPGDQIWIKKGTYTITAPLSMKNGVTIYGGFAGTETQLTQRSFILNETIISGGGTIQVFNNSGINNTAILDGITISNGFAHDGGGMYNSGASPLIRNCIFSANHTSISGVGGGMNNDFNSNPIITNCVFTGNSAYYYGGGIFTQNASSPTISNCIFTGNSSAFGAVACYLGAGFTLQNCSIVGNSGGGIYSGGGGSNVSNSIIYNNSGNNVYGQTNSITYSNVSGSYFVGNNQGSIDANPVFYNAAAPAGADGIWRTADDGLQMILTSPCINAGSSGSGTDILGVTRSSGTPTMGAYETGICPGFNKIYVNAGIAVNGAGDTWATACKSVNEAWRAAKLCSNINTIWVASGTYPVSATLAMRNGLGAFGGFAGWETQINQRNLSANPATLSGGNSRQVFNNANLNNTAVLDGFIISNGNSTTNGAGMNNSYSNPIIRNCVFKNNVCNSTVNEGGGGMFNYYSNPAISNCVFANNTVNNGLFGGGMSNDNSNPVLNNCIFIGNTANDYGMGGGMYNFFSNPVINNSVFTGNSAPVNEGGGMYNQSSAPVITNTIIYGNTATANPNITAGATINYSIIQGGYTGSGNLNADPLFVDAANGNVRLQCGSPAINAGNNSYIPGGIATDLDGNARIQSTTVDMGAYEGAPISTGTTLTTATASDTKIQAGSIYYGSCGSLIAAVKSGGGSPISSNTTANVWIDASQPKQYVKRHYQITPDNNAAIATGTITLYFTQQEFDAFNGQSSAPALLLPTGPGDATGIGNLLIEKRPGTSSDGSGAPATYTGTPTTINPDDANIVWNAIFSRWEISFDVTGFSGFFVKTSQGPLPVNFGDINAVIKNGILTVNWQTLNETNNDRFEIEASDDGIHFNSIGTLQSLAEDGNSNTPIKYQFELTANGIAFGAMAGLGLLALLLPLTKYSRKTVLVSSFILGIAFTACNKNSNDLTDTNDKVIYIRIVQIDKDGAKEYSKVVKAVLE